MLTIGQLAACVGVTVRTVRHYHQRGLLPEPDRDGHDYRRYDAQSVVALMRIRRLAEAGVPLARIDRLLTATAGEFTAIIEEIDQELAAAAAELESRRRRIATLAAGDRLVLTDEVADCLDRLRRIGVGERLLAVERDSSVLLSARFPQHVRQWARQKLAALTDPGFQQLYLEVDASYDWRPDDPRLEVLADACTGYAGRDVPAAQGVSREEPVLLLLAEQIEQGPPSWRRLNELCTQRLHSGTKIEN